MLGLFKWRDIPLAEAFSFAEEYLAFWQRYQATPPVHPHFEAVRKTLREEAPGEVSYLARCGETYYYVWEVFARYFEQEKRPATLEEMAQTFFLPPQNFWVEAAALDFLLEKFLAKWDFHTFVGEFIAAAQEGYQFPGWMLNLYLEEEQSHLLPLTWWIYEKGWAPDGE